MARNVVRFVNAPVGGRERARGEQRGEVGSRRHSDDADLLRVQAPLRGVSADEADAALPVLPCALVERKTLRARSAIHEFHALEARRGELPGPAVHQFDVAKAVVAAA